MRRSGARYVLQPANDFRGVVNGRARYRCAAVLQVTHGDRCGTRGPAADQRHRRHDLIARNPGDDRAGGSGYIERLFQNLARASLDRRHLLLGGSNPGAVLPDLVGKVLQICRGRTRLPVQGDRVGARNGPAHARQFTGLHRIHGRCGATAEF